MLHQSLHWNQNSRLPLFLPPQSLPLFLPHQSLPLHHPQNSLYTILHFLDEDETRGALENMKQAGVVASLSRTFRVAARNLVASSRCVLGEARLTLYQAGVVVSLSRTFRVAAQNLVASSRCTVGDARLTLYQGVDDYTFWFLPFL